MNTQKTVNERIAKVALKNQEVNLGIDDYKNASKQINKLYEELRMINARAKKFSAELIEFRKQAGQISVDAEKTLSNAKSQLKEDLQKAKDLGVNTKVIQDPYNSDNGTVISADEFAEGLRNQYLLNKFFMKTEDERIPMPIGEIYVMEDGSMLVVEEEGVIASISAEC